MGEQSGECLCGAVKVSVKGEHKEAGLCHCDMCRRWTSGPMFAVHVGKDLEISGADNITEYRSSDWAVRAFCKKCGSNLYYKLLGSGEYTLSAGLLDDPSGMQLTNQIFIDEKPEFYDFANDTPKMTGAEVFAMYAPKDEGE